MTPLLTTEQTAEILAVSAESLRRWRREGGGPPFLKLGKLVRYRDVDVQTFIEGSRSGGSRDDVS